MRRITLQESTQTKTKQNSFANTPHVSLYQVDWDGPRPTNNITRSPPHKPGQRRPRLQTPVRVLQRRSWKYLMVIPARGPSVSRLSLISSHSLHTRATTRHISRAHNPSQYFFLLSSFFFRLLAHRSPFQISLTLAASLATPPTTKIGTASVKKPSRAAKTRTQNSWRL